MLFSPAALDGEAAGFEEWDETVGELTLELEDAGFDFASTTEGRLQFSQEIVQLGRAPDGGKSFEDEDGFSAAVGGGAAQEESLDRFFFWGGRSRWWNVRSLAQGAKVERGKRIGAQLGCGVGGYALFLFPRHG